MDKPLLVGIAGGTSAGKSTFAEKIAETLGPDRAVTIAEASYYYDMSHLPEAERKKINFDQPQSIDFPLMTSHLKHLIDGHSVPKLTYKPDLCVRDDSAGRIEPTELIIVEGILILAEQSIRELLDVRIYIDADSDLRFIRRLEKEMDEKRNDFETVCSRYIESVKPMHLKYVAASKQYADVIVPQGSKNLPALRMVLSMIHAALQSEDPLGA